MSKDLAQRIVDLNLVDERRTPPTPEYEAMKLINLIRNVEGEEIYIIKGRAIVVRPAEVNDLDRINKGFQCMD